MKDKLCQLVSGEMISVLKLVSCDLIVCDDGNAKVVQDALTGLGLQKVTQYSVWLLLSCLFTNAASTS